MTRERGEIDFGDGAIDGLRDEQHLAGGARGVRRSGRAAARETQDRNRDSESRWSPATIGNRPDLVLKEEAEAVVLAAYMPAQMSDAEVDAILAAAVAEVAATGVTGNAAMGKIMAIVKPKLAGKADMSAVSGKVKAKLG